MSEVFVGDSLAKVDKERARVCALQMQDTILKARAEFERKDIDEYIAKYEKRSKFLAKFWWKRKPLSREEAKRRILRKEFAWIATYNWHSAYSKQMRICKNVARLCSNTSEDYVYLSGSDAAAIDLEPLKAPPEKEETEGNVA